MGTGRLEKNTIVCLDGRDHRIQAILPDGTYQLEDNVSGRIKPLGSSELASKYRRGELSIPAVGPRPRQKTTAPLSEEELSIIRVRREYVRAMQGVPNTRGRVELVIDETWQKIKKPAQKPSFVTAYRWRKRYKKSGEDARSLLDNHQAKGRRGSRFPIEVIEICNRAIDRFFLRREGGGTIQDVLDEAMHRTMEENRMRPSETRLPLPSRRLVKRLIDAIPAIDREIARKGRQSARYKYRAVLGSHVTSAPLERAQIDHTLLDIMVIDDRSHLPLGRPTLTLCIDRFTRCVLGFYIGFKPASFETVAACLKHCFRPKDDLKEHFPEIDNDWPCFGVMQTLVMDNGRDFHTPSLATVCLSLNIEMDYCAVRTPWLKGEVERYFGTVSRGLLHKLPGTTMSSISEKGDYDPEKNAVVTLSELHKWISKWIVDVYHVRPHRTLGASPLEMWNQSVRIEDIPLPDDSVDLDLVLSASIERVLTHKGIELFGLPYNGRELARQRNLRGHQLQVSVRYDPGDLGEIHVVFEDGQAVKAPCLRWEYANGLSEYQHAVIKRRRAEMKLPDNAAGYLKAKAKLQELIAEALAGRRRLGSRAARYSEDLKKRRYGPTTVRNDPTSITEERGSLIANTAYEPVAQPTKEFNEDELLDFATTSRY